MFNVVYDPFLTRTTTISEKNYDTFFTLFVLSRASDNTTSQNIGGTDARAVPPPQIGGCPPCPPVPLGLRPCFVALLDSLEFHTFPQRLPSSPRQLNSPFHILVRPLLCADVSFQIHKILRLLQFLSFQLYAKFLVSPPPEVGILSSVCLSSCPFLAHLCDSCQRLL